MCGCKFVNEKVTGTAAVPDGTVCTSVRFPSDVDVPQSNHAVADPPPGLAVPFKVTEVEVTAAASAVVAVTPEVPEVTEVPLPVVVNALTLP